MPTQSNSFRETIKLGLYHLRILKVGFFSDLTFMLISENIEHSETLMRWSKSLCVSLSGLEERQE